MQQPNPDFWRNKRVLLTGHTGFKGSWLSIWLQSLNVTLRGVALPPATTPALFQIASIADGMDHHLVDIREFDSVKKAIFEFEPEIVIHMAAQPLVRYSYQYPIETYATNVMGTVHVLEAARQVGSVKSIVNVTTDKCYDNREWVWGYRETDPMGGHDPYSSSKGCAEIISAAYRKSFMEESDIALATARAGNVIGGGDWASDRLIPDIMRSLEKNQHVLIRNPHAIRPWQHVLEPLSGYLVLAERLYIEGTYYTEAWNFGPNDEDARPVSWVVEYLCNAWGNDTSWAQQPGNHPHEAGFLKLDISKARQRLDWNPYWPIETALDHVMDWHRAWLEGKDMKQECLKQIELYGVKS